MFGRNKVMSVQEAQERLRRRFPAITGDSNNNTWHLDDGPTKIDEEYKESVIRSVVNDFDTTKSLKDYPQDFQDLMRKVATEFFDQRYKEEEKLIEQKRKIIKIQKESEADYIKKVIENKDSITDTTPKELVQKIEQIKKKADYIDEKSKLTEKQLLAEIVILLENIRNDAKINSETMNDKLNTISSATLDSKYELEAQTQADKKHRKDNTGPSWEL